MARALERLAGEERHADGFATPPRGGQQTSRIEGEIVIGRPVEEVFDFVADERNRYDPHILRAEKITDGPIGRGTRFRSETRSAGRTVGMVVEITEYGRPRRLATSTETSSMTIRSTLEFDPVPEGTRARVAT